LEESRSTSTRGVAPENAAMMEKTHQAAARATALALVLAVIGLGYGFAFANTSNDPPDTPLSVPSNESPEEPSTATPPERPVELGRIPWLRDFDAALEKAKSSAGGRQPVMVLFDEVPGCHTCQSFGRGPLSHPIVVDAASEFVCVAVYNNVSGGDEKILKKYAEPAWNNPVVRFVDAAGKDILPRHADDYTTAGLLARMTEALEKAGQDVPEYLRLVNAEYNPSKRETATFAMHCYWVGEQKLGALDGVLGTRIGMLDGLEVVEVAFDPAVLPYRQLVEKAKSFECADKVFARTDEQATVAGEVVGPNVVRSDKAVDTSTTQQYHLHRTAAYYYLPLTALQATKVNAAIASQTDPDRYLSPGQLAMKAKIERAIANRDRRLADTEPDRSEEGITRYAEHLAGLVARH
jgi:hypothetical protein